ncbi:hypothetical protein OXX69_012468, partial [Metschnikowia pulcherrima]
MSTRTNLDDNKDRTGHNPNDYGDASSSSTELTKTTEFVPYRLSATRVISNFHTDATQGLSSSQVEDLKRQYGE